VDRDIPSKFGLQISFDLSKQVLLVTKPEARSGFYDYGSHVVKSYDVITPSQMVHTPISMKFGRPMQNDIPVTIDMSKSKPEVEFQYGRRVFSKPELHNSRGVGYLVEIWFADKFQSSQINEVTPSHLKRQ